MAWFKPVVVFCGRFRGTWYLQKLCFLFIIPNSPPLHKLNSLEGIEDIDDFVPVSDSQRGTTEECYAIEDGTTPKMCLPRSEQPYFANYWIGADRFPRPHRLKDRM
ncbi:hypothetical protein LXL04_012543 [Taraxacum kok-saghyz]